MSLETFFDPLVDLFLGSSLDPVVYSFGFFFYVVLSHTVIPTPLEVGLVINMGGPPPMWIRTLIVGAGMMVGASLVFLFGTRLEDRLDDLGRRHRYLGTLLNVLQGFVARTRYLGLFLIMSIPGMIDTVPLYLFALFNRRNVMKFRFFALTIFFAGIVRATLFYIILLLFGVAIL